MEFAPSVMDTLCALFCRSIGLGLTAELQAARPNWPAERCRHAAQSLSAQIGSPVAQSGSARREELEQGLNSYTHRHLAPSHAPHADEQTVRRWQERWHRYTRTSPAAPRR